jgi:hypothetical protein
MVPREKGLQLLGGGAVVHDRPRLDPAERDAHHLGVGVDGIPALRGDIRDLHLRGLGADHRAVRLHHPRPVEGELLVPRRPTEAELVVVLHRLGAEDLHHGAVGPGAAAVGLEADDAVVEEPDRCLFRVVRRVNREGVDGVVLDRRVAPRGDAGGLGFGLGLDEGAEGEAEGEGGEGGATSHFGSQGQGLRVGAGRNAARVAVGGGVREEGSPLSATA